MMNNENKLNERVVEINRSLNSYSDLDGNAAIQQDQFRRDPNHIAQEVQANLAMLEDLQSRMGFWLSEINGVIKKA